MIYKDYKIGPINLHTIKTDKFRLCHMEIIFRNEIIKEDLAKRSFLFEMLTENNKTFPKRRDLILHLEELYNTYLYSVNSTVGSTILTSLCLDFIDPKYTKGDYLKEVLFLPFDIINNPNVNNNEFDTITFDVVKKRLELDIKSVNENPKKKSIVEALKEMDDQSVSSYLINGELKDLERITPSNLYEYYETILNHDLIDIYIIGNLDMDKVAEIIRSYSKFNIIKDKETKLFVDNKTRKKVKIASGYMDISQANLAIILNLSDLTKYERDYVINVYNGILGSGALDSKLYKYLREENSLCYNVSSMYQKYDQLLIIQTAINKENYNLAVKLIKKALKEMELGKFSENEIDNSKEMITSSLNFSQDNPGSILDNYLYQNIAGLDPIEIRKEKYLNVTKNDIIKLAKKIKINTIYLLSDGDKNE